MWKVVMQYPSGEEEEQDEEFETEAEAEAFGSDMCSCYSLGGEILHAHNPGDYPDEGDEADFYVYEVFEDD